MTPALFRAARLCAGALVLLLAAAVPAAAQKLGQGADDGIETWRVVAALALCLGLAVAGAYAIRLRFGTLPPLLANLRGARQLKLIESLRLGPQSDLHVVECDGQRMLVASSPAGVAILDKLSATPPIPGTAAVP
jgi:flagellar biogenesis protein FliO